MDKLFAFLNSPVGPKTVHFWGPAANWGLVGAALADSDKPAASISRNMTITLFCYSLFFMRFAWCVQPRNYFLLTCHMCNSSMQLWLLKQRMNYEWSQKDQIKEVEETIAYVAAVTAKQ